MRGVCYNHTGKGYGFLRYMKTIAPELWKIDARQPDSPYDSVFFHNSQLPDEVHAGDLPSRSYVFEFELGKAEGRENGLQAVNMQLVSPRRRMAGPPTNGAAAAAQLPSSAGAAVTPVAAPPVAATPPLPPAASVPPPA